jgi:diaminopimelate epimerase
MKFEKWTALGNDYLIVEAAALPWELSPDRVRRICDPHFGVGSDGILLLAPHEDPEIVAELRIFNPDGSEAELSGNGAREAVMYLRRAGWTDADEFTILTKAGPITPTIRSERECTLEMGSASTTSADFPSGGEDGRGEVEAAGRTWSFQHVSIGNPQCAIAVTEELESLDLRAIGPQIENSELFPNRTNVSFFRADGDRVRARIFERGVGETLSSGIFPRARARPAQPSPRTWQGRRAISPWSWTVVTCRSKSATGCRSASPAGPSPSTRASSPRSSCGHSRCSPSRPQQPYSSGSDGSSSEEERTRGALTAPRRDPAVHVRRARTAHRNEAG